MSLLGILLVAALIVALVVFTLIEVEDNKTASKPPMGLHPWWPPESNPEGSEPESSDQPSCDDRA